MAAALLAGALPARADNGYRELELEVERRRSGLLFVRFDGDERRDLLIGSDSEIRVQLQKPDGSYDKPLVLDLGKELGGGMFDTADLDGDGREELYVLHSGGVDGFAFDAATKKIVRGKPLLEGQRGLPFLHLASEDFLRDLDGDGDLDFAFPLEGRVHVYVQEKGAFVKRGQVEMERAEVRVSAGQRDLGSRVQTRIEVPRFETSQVVDPEGQVEVRLGSGVLRSGDSAALLAGDFTLKKKADPLAAFRAKRGIKPADGEGFQSILQDLDDDGINDYTIVFQNRIWVYKGTREGFDFDRAPDQLLKVAAADRLAVVLLPLNDDARPDLILFKYEVPSVARLAAALAIGLRTEIEILGYYNDGKPVFSRKPDERSTFVVRVPPILRLIGEIEEIGLQFQDILRPMQSVASGDFDGDGRADVLRAASGHLEIYLTTEGEPPIDLGAARSRELLRAYGGHELVRRALFDRERRDITLESSMSLLREVVDGLQSAIVADRAPALKLPINSTTSKRVDQILADDLNGDGRGDIVVFLDPPPREQRADPEAAIEKQTLRLWLSEPGVDTKLRSAATTPGGSR
jgi:hypothetical protein